MKQTITEIRHTAISPVAELFKPHGPKQSLGKVLGSHAMVEARKPTALAPVLRPALGRPSQGKARLAPAPRSPQLPQPQTFTLDEIKGALTNLRQTLEVERAGTLTLTLPLGLEHYLVNAATFKALAGRNGDTLLRQAGKRWEIVEDDEQIDLGDRSQLFKLGKVQVYS